MGQVQKQKQDEDEMLDKISKGIDGEQCVAFCWLFSTA